MILVSNRFPSLKYGTQKKGTKTLYECASETGSLWRFSWQRAARGRTKNKKKKFGVFVFVRQQTKPVVVPNRDALSIPAVKH